MYDCYILVAVVFGVPLSVTGKVRYKCAALDDIACDSQCEEVYDQFSVSPTKTYPLSLFTIHLCSPM